jgi:peptidoglycan/LPS O-acetylase OafA/YrhL
LEREERQYFEFLDGLRGLAALAVLWGHLLAIADAPSSKTFVVAVDFFFILSGFVIAHAYGEALAGGMKVLDFLRIRVVRLYPMLLLGLALGLVVVIWQQARHGSIDPLGIAWMLAANLFCLPALTNKLPQVIFPFNLPQWSLFFEMGVNLAFAFLARRLTQLSCLLLAAIGAVGLVAAVAAFGSIDVGPERDTLPGGLARVTFGFFAGVVLYRLRPRSPVAAPVGLLIAVGLLVLLVGSPELPMWALLTLVLVVFPGVVWLSAGVSLSGRVRSASLLLGALSYPIYIVHFPLVLLFHDLLDLVAPQRAHSLVLLLAQAALIIVVCWFALRFLDAPVRSWLRKLTRSPGFAPAN